MFSDTGFSLVQLMYEIMDGRRLETQPNWGASICRLMSDCWREEPEVTFFSNVNMVILGPKVAEEIFRKNDVTFVLDVM